MLVKKVGAHPWREGELEDAVGDFARDMTKLRKYVKVAERSLAENLSRHFPA